ncbi:hypothetical protein [Amycolatopsis sp. SID8362]|uniref:hypothetical protein n=1 Tax=Amycolatopsis sp. SID8362 TaxID=2690346 RepID=UPI00136C178B|nr:hypothetical protein [Amycolatopsis sp. SID8362]NBH07736.1 hypothetical protein [Amycolatopsis sp. SID8362]NED44431.1 hypothetical protein [Amycolatopsis sp. SID8362]
MQLDSVFTAAIETLGKLPRASVDCAIAEPDLEQLQTEAVVTGISAVWRALHGVLRPAGTAWLIASDRCDSGSLTGLPWRVAFAVQREGWLLRNAVVAERRSVGLVFLCVRQPRYFFELEPLRESGVRPGDVVLPGSRGLVERCVLAGCPAGGDVLNLFGAHDIDGAVRRLGRRVVSRPSSSEVAA